VEDLFTRQRHLGTQRLSLERGHLNFDGEIILGEIQLNNANRFIFNPDNGKVYSISTNLLLKHIHKPS
jgi:hypothetical protein